MSALLCKMTVTLTAYKLLTLLCHDKLWGMETYTSNSQFISASSNEHSKVKNCGVTVIELLQTP